MSEAKIKIIELVRSKETFDYVLNLPLISEASRFRLKLIAKEINPLIADYTESAEAIKYEFCVEGPDNSLFIPYKNQPLAKAQTKVLNEQEVTFKCKKFKLFDLRVKPNKENKDENGLAWATAAVLYDLDWLIETPEPTEETETTEE